jgi:hypothetical protein
VNTPPEPNFERQLESLRVLIEEHAAIECSILQVGADTWALHGVIAVDGEVLLAEFRSYDEARAALDQLRAGGELDL